MRYLGRPVLALVAALAITLAMESATAVAQPTDGALFQYMVGKLPANQHVSITFTSCVESIPATIKQYLGQTKNSQLVFKFGRTIVASHRRGHSTRGES
jgi:hypothetical protein